MPPTYRFTHPLQGADGPWGAFLRWLFRIAPWVQPMGDNVADRWLDTDPVLTAEPFAWAPELQGVPVRPVWQAEPWQGSVPGMPVQLVPTPDRRNVRKVLEVNTYTGVTQWRDWPVPTAGDWCVEGYPSTNGAWDRHCLLVCEETGEAWEAIQFNPDANTCLAWAHYRDGQLVDGMGVFAGHQWWPHPMSSLVLDRADVPHLMPLALNDYVGWDGSKAEGSGWPHCGDVLRLAPARAAQLLAQPLTWEQQLYVQAARDVGFLLYDRGRTTTPTATVPITWGAQWYGSTLLRPEVRFTLADLELVTSRGTTPTG